jgi:dTMP kinase
MIKNNFKGKFVVVDGTDGSGKATQVRLLVEHLRKKGRLVKTIDFPQYYNNFFGKFVGECLAGKHGDFLKSDPYVASVLYAADRLESSTQITEWLKQGNIVIADRYASSNQIHQGGKIKNEAERKNFLEWLEKMEFEVFKIPKPDAIIYLDVPLETTQKLIEIRAKRNQAKKRYLKGGRDAHESNPLHLADAKASAMDLVQRYNNWIKINCARDGKLMSKKEIHNIIWNIFLNKIN